MYNKKSSRLGSKGTSTLYKTEKPMTEHNPQKKQYLTSYMGNHASAAPRVRRDQKPPKGQERKPVGYFSPHNKLDLHALYFRYAPRKMLGQIRRAVRKAGVPYWTAPGFEIVSPGVCEVLCAREVEHKVVDAVSKLGIRHLQSYGPIKNIRPAFMERETDCLEEMYLTWVNASIFCENSGGGWEWYKAMADLARDRIELLKKNKVGSDKIALGPKAVTSTLRAQASGLSRQKEKLESEPIAVTTGDEKFIGPSMPQEATVPKRPQVGLLFSNSFAVLEQED